MEYPYFIVPAVEKYRSLDPNSEEAKELSRKIAANIGDIASLRLILGIDPPEFARFYPDMEVATPTTLDTIDSFLDKFGGEGAATGYMAQAMAESPGSLNPEDVENDAGSEKEVSEEDLGYLLKTKQFQRALTFIEHQNLIYPNKSIYFALQIRFIKKLMAVENYRNKTKG